jgi:hypothetical protein
MAHAELGVISAAASLTMASRAANCGRLKRCTPKVASVEQANPMPYEIAQLRIWTNVATIKHDDRC